MFSLPRRAVLGAFAATTIAISTPAFAEDVLKFAHVYETATPYHEAALQVAEEFAKGTDGRYKIEVFPASQLGKEAALNEGLSLGTVDMIYTGVAFLGQSYPPISISDYPFTLRDYDHWKAYANSDLFTELAQSYTDVTGNHVVAMTYYGSRQVTSNKPILKPADMEGLKIRTPNAPAYQMFPAATGANPTPMAFSEVYLALQQGVVDAQENPLPTIQFKKFYEVQTNINLTSHITNSLVTLISPATVAKLSDEDLATLKDAIRHGAEWASNEIVASEASLADWFREQGVTVNEVDRGPFIEAVSPALTGSNVPWDAEVYERLQAIK
ncbi:tripartite ATP-independent transporter solute receptor, DctP family [Aliiroseovarius halocynthiae]|uniref:DctP family TRAP transporter solute-binding subunit n=1 Tax=Aliiroseovarius halocynthiae TaxID=985055 RepID=A0A545SL74_9RHOB|nr:sialic acid TRAP transporter substrate-binding protein SiaP [Aliiroseovarius halocynthiae]TQV65718.1 DctP family TRAP transporter solute-binding subunit [Aliiroseovarius halocynthiae]SMR83967.1 tripartite ATP-independent transporter solute receptor, DctP family [Aliiroseovarius halocynthiae]